MTSVEVPKARVKLGYNSQIKIAAGMPKLVEWFRATRFIAPLALLLCLAGCSGSIEPTDQVGLESIFKKEFHFDPPTGTRIRAKVVQVRDSLVVWVIFTGDEKLLKQITDKESKSVKLAEAQEVYSFATRLFHNPNAPRWWPKSIPEKVATIYVRDTTKVPQSPSVSTDSHCWRDADLGIIYWTRSEDW